MQISIGLPVFKCPPPLSLSSERAEEVRLLTVLAESSLSSLGLRVYAGRVSETPCGHGLVYHNFEEPRARKRRREVGQTACRGDSSLTQTT